MRWKLAVPWILAPLASCSMIGHEPVRGWPALEIVEHYVPHAEMRDVCAPHVGFGASPEACAQFDLAARKCHIWFSADFPPPAWMVEHERLHCRGYDHVGSNAMANYLRYWNGSAAAGASR